jgi:hypothetical protein
VPGGEPLQERDVDVLATAEDVVHKSSRDPGALRHVLDRDQAVAALGEQRVGVVEDLVALRGRVQASVGPRALTTASVRGIGNSSTNY